MGPGGSGKSTLVRLLSGKLPDSSELDIVGRITRPEAGRIGIVTQRSRHSGLSLRAMLMDVESTTMSAVENEDWAAYLKREGLQRLALPLDQPADILSRSEQQLLRIAAARWSGPELLILDEPFAGLHGGQEDELMRYVDGLKAEHTVVLVEHHQARARALSNRVALLAAGQLIEVNETERFFEHPQSMHSEQFIRSGGCSVSSVDAELALLTFDTENPSLRRMSDIYRGAATPRPEGRAQYGYPAHLITPSTAYSPEIPLPQGHGQGRQNSDETLDTPSPRRSAVPSESAPPVHEPLLETQRPEGYTSPADVLSTLHGQARILPSSAVRPSPTLVQDMAPAVTYRHPPAQRSLGLSSEMRGRGPQGFCWLTPGELAGCPRPGIVEPISRDLDRIARTGTQVIVTLTQTELDVSADDLSLFHEVCYFPVVDMEAPHRETAIDVCRRMEQHIQEGRAVVYHCRAGLGRTGTMLVMHLIGRGMASKEALAMARSMNAYWVQSQSQEDFLHTLPTGFLLNA